MKEEITLKLVQIQLQFKFLHWQTFGDAKHKAYGEIYDSMGDNIDRLVESMMGKYGRIQFDSEFSIMFQDISALSVQNFMDGITEFLVGMTEQLDPKYDSDLLNIRDEILGDINQTKYRLTLKY
jgi:hypothetical protein|tara:strand:+ start:237 stop:608 length:372 start_codon:yes stop_codon:yes gene_type:complete